MAAAPAITSAARAQNTLRLLFFRAGLLFIPFFFDLGKPLQEAPITPVNGFMVIYRNRSFKKHVLPTFFKGPKS
jgi:hypothetical protein